MQTTHFALFKIKQSGCCDAALELTLSGSSSCEVASQLMAILPQAVMLARSPEHVLTLSTYSRLLAGIPKEAESFFFVYPYSDSSRLRVKNLEKAGLRREVGQ